MNKWTRIENKIGDFDSNQSREFRPTELMNDWGRAHKTRKPRTAAGPPRRARQGPPQSPIEYQISENGLSVSS